MTKRNFAIIGAVSLAVAACGGQGDDATNNLVDNSYDANAMSMDNATENLSEMDNLNAQEESLNAEAIDESDVTVEEAGDGAAGM